jgi:hypothetical protein
MEGEATFSHPMKNYEHINSTGTRLSFGQFFKNHVLNGTVFCAAIKAAFLEFLWPFGAIVFVFFSSYDTEIIPKIIIFSIVGIVVFIPYVLLNYLVSFARLRNPKTLEAFLNLSARHQGKKIGGFL